MTCKTLIYCDDESNKGKIRVSSCGGRNRDSHQGGGNSGKGPRQTIVATVGAGSGRESRGSSIGRQQSTKKRQQAAEKAVLAVAVATTAAAVTVVANGAAVAAAALMAMAAITAATAFANAEVVATAAGVTAAATTASLVSSPSRPRQRWQWWRR